jgi:hypothetical protein
MVLYKNNIYIYVLFLPALVTPCQIEQLEI